MPPAGTPTAVLGSMLGRLSAGCLSFKARLLLLVALAVSLPVIATCVVLGMELNSQARVLFAQGLQSGLQTFSLLIADLERTLTDGVRRSAADNTLQVTLDLEIKAQLSTYLEQQRQILGIEFLAAYTKDGRLLAMAHPGNASGASWQLTTTKGLPEADCTASAGGGRQVAWCNRTAYVVSAFPVLRAQPGLGDAGWGGAQHLGDLVGGTPVAAPGLLAALRERQLDHPLLWVEDTVVYSSLSQPIGRTMVADGAVREYEVGKTPYLGVARSTPFGTRRLEFGLLTPLAPLRKSLYESVAAVVGIGALVIAATLLMISFLANQMLEPIRRLQEGALRIGEGDLAHRISIASGDELEALADQFNDMSSKLEESYANLEKKVEERTGELRQSLERLDEKSRQLEIASQHKSQFVANMSHELRTPLAAILGYAELMQEGFYGPLPEDSMEALTRVRSNGKHLLGLINSVLDIAKIESGQFTLNLVEYAIDSVVETVREATESLATAKNLALRTEVAPQLPRGFGDEPRLTQVLLNLVGNAIKFTDAGEVRIAARVAGQSFLLTVADTGPGIPAHEQARIFEQFHQIDDANTRTKGGTGLGLAIAKQIVELHEGRIWVESVPGRGSTFHVELPIRPQSVGAGR